MSGLEKALFNLKASHSGPQHQPSHSAHTDTHDQFTAKQLNRQAAKASKDEKTEKDKLKKVLILQISYAGEPR
jgi:charged multivesicular body protein 1